jgi:hypothetical protein
MTLSLFALHDPHQSMIFSSLHSYLLSFHSQWITAVLLILSKDLFHFPSSKMSSVFFSTLFAKVTLNIGITLKSNHFFLLNLRTSEKDLVVLAALLQKISKTSFQLILVMDSNAHERFLEAGDSGFAPVKLSIPRGKYGTSPSIQTENPGLIKIQYDSKLSSVYFN